MESILFSRLLLGLQETAADLACTTRSLDLNFGSVTGTSSPLPHFIASMGNSVHNGFGVEASDPDREDMQGDFSQVVDGDESDIRTSPNIF